MCGPTTTYGTAVRLGASLFLCCEQQKNYSIMKSFKQPPMMEKKYTVPVLGSPLKIKGSGSNGPQEVKVRHESRPNNYSKPRIKKSSKKVGSNDRKTQQFPAGYQTRVHEYMNLIQSDSTAAMSSGLAGSLLNLNTSYPVRMAQMVTVQTNASSVCAFSQFVDPSASGQNFAEYSTWTTLFNQVRVRHFKISIVPVQKPGTLALNYAGLVAGCLTTLGVPTSLTSLAENADSRIHGWSIAVKPFVHELHFNPVPLWADITTPDPGDNIGTPGCIMGYYDGMTASVDAFRILVEGVYEFRSRT